MEKIPYDNIGVFLTALNKEVSRFVINQELKLL